MPHISLVGCHRPATQSASVVKHNGINLHMKPIRIDRFFQMVEKTVFPDGEKTVFSTVKTGLAKIVFADKNRFLPELSSK